MYHYTCTCICAHGAMVYIVMRAVLAVRRFTAEPQKEDAQSWVWTRPPYLSISSPCAGQCRDHPQAPAPAPHTHVGSFTLQGNAPLCFVESRTHGGCRPW